MLEKTYLGVIEVGNERVWPIEGILLGPNSRPMVSLGVRCASQTNAINVFFIVDTGAATTHLSKHALEAVLGNGNPVPNSAALCINGNILPVRLSDSTGYNADLCVLGADFFRKAHVTLKVNYVQQTVTLRTA
ncbi:hypothetical protein JKP88DRAFT_167844 [Tribonema minus]|uniref:Peptidase A2 domain-containing protein n=1 Tax=Tribonema minus TaxID=303371 RepID=A0A835YPV0_9STRA|nr:hypothetical protein JKP88DRAFT_167844 [Tribonema minus]